MLLHAPRRLSVTLTMDITLPTVATRPYTLGSLAQMCMNYMWSLFKWASTRVIKQYIAKFKISLTPQSLVSRLLHPWARPLAAAPVVSAVHLFSQYLPHYIFRVSAIC